MSTITITKGLPISLLIGLTQFDSTINLNDDTWLVEVSLRHKTERGAEPFPLTVIPTSNSVLVEITSAQTATLDSIDKGYVLVVKVSKLDDTVFLRNVLQAYVVDDL